MSGSRPGEVSPRWAAKKLGYHVKTVRRWCQACVRGDNRWFGSVRVDRDNNYWIQRSEIDRLLAEDVDLNATGGRRFTGEQTYVYFIAAPELQVVKIGVALDPDKRLMDLQVGNPAHLTLMGAVVGGRAEESELHRRFSSLRVRGEWFRLAGPILSYVAGIAESGNTREQPR